MLKEPKSVDEIIEASKKEPVIIYKHSATCGLSMKAKNQINSFSQEFPEVPIFQITVQTQRDLSNEVEEATGIEHQSPQVIILKDEKPEADFSHSFIKKDKIEMMVDKLRK